MNLLKLFPIFFPIIMGFILLKSKIDERNKLYKYVAAIICINAIVALIAIFTNDHQAVVLFDFFIQLELVFRIDGMSSLFGGMVSILWVITTFYAFEYMKHEGKEKKFFGFYTMAFGVVLGIAFAGNMFTLYIFYEFLTLSTIPLVMHAMDGKAIYAGKVYITYMMIGASLAFIGFIFIYIYGGNTLFTLGGTLKPDLVEGNESILRLVFLLTCLGFGVKAAIFPFSTWLPTASVAPTPVTALLHAVAVVKSGIFAIIRLLYFSIGTELIANTWEQKVIMVLAMITIVYGSVMALRCPHIKRRFAYSTISNLSYIILGLIMCSNAGLAAGVLHMIFHAIIKITLFFGAGAILYKTHKEYLNDIKGYGYKMPIVFITMMIASLALIGVPPFPGFFSKWALANAAIENGSILAYLGVAALIISALLTALYCISIFTKAFMYKTKDNVEDPNRLMTIPLICLSIAIVFFAIKPAYLIDLISSLIGL